MRLIAPTVLAGLAMAAGPLVGAAASPEPDPGTSGIDTAFTIGIELEPGTYTSRAFATPVSFTVPEGWKVFEDGPGQFGLARMANDGPPLLVLRDIDAAATDCSEEAEPGIGRSAEAMSMWLADHEGLVTSEPVPASIGGLDGYVVDVSLDPAWTGTCWFSGGQPIVMTIVGSALSRGPHWGVDAQTLDRMWVLDLPTVQEGNLVVVADVCCGVDPDEQLGAVQEVVDTFSFDASIE